MGLYRMSSSPYWWYSFMLNGKQVCRSSKQTDKKQAKKIFEHERSQFVLGEKTGVLKPIKLKELIQTYLNDYSKGRKRSYADDVSISKRVLAHFGENVMAAEVSRADIERYMTLRRQKQVNGHALSPSTVNLEVAFLRAVYNKAIEWQLVKLTPCAGIKLFSTADRARLRHITPDEQQRLLAACPPLLRRMVLVALRTGARQGEILGLRWEDLDPAKGIVKFPRTKNGRVRYVPLHADLAELFNAMPKVGEWVFPYEPVKGSLRRLSEGRDTGPAIWDGALRSQWEQALAETGITDFRFHDLRHTVASDLAMKGASLQAIAAILGHATTRMSERYAHLTPNYVGVSLALLPSLGDKGENGNRGKTPDPMAAA